jgi:hypothetical protein
MTGFLKINFKKNEKVFRPCVPADVYTDLNGRPYPFYKSTDCYHEKIIETLEKGKDQRITK